MKTKRYEVNLVVSIIILLIIPAIGPMATGNNTIAHNKESSPNQDDFIFYAGSDSNYTSESIVLNKYLLFMKYNGDALNSKDGGSFEEIFSTSLQYGVETRSDQTSNGGPMDSSWPMFGHDVRHTGQSPYSTVNNPGTEEWRFECDWVEDSPIIDSDGTIYLGGGHGGLPWYLYAIYQNGMEKWKFKTDGLILGSSPAIDDDGTIYVGSWDWGLYALYPNGTLKWRFPSGATVASSPAIDDNGVIYYGVMGPGDNKGRIYALYPNGIEKWHFDTGYWIVSNPAIGDDGTVYIGSGDSYLYALYPNGTLRWRFNTGDDIHGHPSIADDGTIYIGSWDDHLYAIYPNGTMKWSFHTEWGTSNNQAIGDDGTIYVGTDKLYAIYPNGTLRWSFVLGNDEWVAKSSPAIASEGTIYIGTQIGDGAGGEIIAVNPDGTEKWRKRIANYWVDSSPSIAEDGTVYIGSAYDMSGGYLHAFNYFELEADAHGPYIGIINEPVQFTGSADGGYPPYSYHWGFGDDNTSDEQNPTHEYDTAGNYTVTLTVTDDNDTTAVDTTYALIRESNDPPGIPDIEGETHGYYGDAYDYTFIATDIDGDDIWYFIEWGDESTSGWVGPYESDEEITRSHTWDDEGTYIIRAKAKDIFDAEGEWGTLEVTMPVNQQYPFPLLQRFLERVSNAFPIFRHLLGIWY